MGELTSQSELWLADVRMRLLFSRECRVSDVGYSHLRCAYRSPSPVTGLGEIYIFSSAFSTITNPPIDVNDRHDHKSLGRYSTMTDIEQQDNGRLASDRGLERTTTDPNFGDAELNDSSDNEITHKESRASGSGSSLALSTTRASRRQTAQSVLSRVRSRPPVGKFSHPLSHFKTTVEDLVEFDGDADPYRPVNWSMKKKVITTALYGLTTMTATWASATISPGTAQIAHEFRIGSQTATLSTTLFLFGFGLGPLLWAPLSN